MGSLSSVYYCFVVGVFAGLSTGCGLGGGPSTVNGTITFNGEPVTSGTVTFVKSEGGLVREGALIKDGKFTARLPPGKYKIEVNSQKVVGKRKQRGFDGKVEEVEQTEEMFPAKFNSKSELTEEIKSGSNTIQLELKST